MLQEVTFSLKPGEMLGLVGANGSGKSTLLALVSGILTPDRGTIIVQEMHSPGEEKEIRGKVRLVMQDSDLHIIGSTVQEDLLLGRDNTDISTVKHARNTAARFGLEHQWDRPVHTLSWGQKRKLCLAAAMLDRPKALLLDEPFSGLDYPGIREMRSILRRNRETGLTQMVAAHDLEPMIDLVHSLAVLFDGRLVRIGPPEEVLEGIRRYHVRPPCSWINEKRIVPWDQDHEP